MNDVGPFFGFFDPPPLVNFLLRKIFDLEVEVVRISLQKMKVWFKDIHLSAQFQKSQTILVVWSFCTQSTITPIIYIVRI